MTWISKQGVPSVRWIMDASVKLIPHNRTFIVARYLVRSCELSIVIVKLLVVVLRSHEMTSVLLLHILLLADVTNCISALLVRSLLWLLVSVLVLLLTEHACEVVSIFIIVLILLLL